MIEVREDDVLAALEDQQDALLELEGEGAISEETAHVIAAIEYFREIGYSEKQIGKMTIEQILEQYDTALQEDQY